MQFALVFNSVAIRNIFSEARGKRCSWDIIGVSRPVIISAYTEELWGAFDDYEVPVNFHLGIWDLDEAEEAKEIREDLIAAGVAFYTPTQALVDQCLKLK